MIKREQDVINKLEAGGLVHIIREGSPRDPRPTFKAIMVFPRSALDDQPVDYKIIQAMEAKGALKVLVNGHICVLGAN